MRRRTSLTAILSGLLAGLGLSRPSTSAAQDTAGLFVSHALVLTPPDQQPNCEGLLRDAQRAGVREIYLNVGILDSGGNLTSLDHADPQFETFAPACVQRLQAGSPRISVYAWVNGRSGPGNPLASLPANVRGRIVQDCLELLDAPYHFDGILMDIEPLEGFVLDDMAAGSLGTQFLRLLDELEDALDLRPLGVHAAQLRTAEVAKGDPNKILWSTQNFQQVLQAGLADFVTMNTYDYGDTQNAWGFDNQADYGARLRDTVRELPSELRARTMLGFSADVQTSTHTRFESVAAGMAGYDQALPGQFVRGRFLYLYFGRLQDPEDPVGPHKDITPCDWSFFARRPFAGCTTETLQPSETRTFTPPPLQQPTDWVLNLWPLENLVEESPSPACGPVLSVFHPDGQMERQIDSAGSLVTISLSNAAAGAWSYQVSNPCQTPQSIALADSSNPGPSVPAGLLWLLPLALVPVLRRLRRQH